MRKFLYITIILLCILVVIINVLSSFDIPLLNFRIYKIASGSMEPSLKINDLVIVKQQDDYKVGDIITYKKEDDKITHRIVSIDNNLVVTKGDANNVNDISFPRKNILGKVIFVFKYFGFLSFMFSKPLFLIFIFIIGLVYTILIPDKKNARKEINHEKENSN